MSVPVAMTGLLYVVWLPRHYVSLGIGFAAVGVAIGIVRIVDVSFDPLLALAMDRTRTAIGRYRPWLVFGTPMLMLGVWKATSPLGPVSQLYLIVWLVVSYAGLSMVTLGHAAWSAVVAIDYHDRGRLAAWVFLMGIAANGVIQLMPFLSHGHITPGQKTSFPILGLIVVSVLPISLFICATFTPESIALQAQRPTFSLADYRSAIARQTTLRLMLADFLFALGPGLTAPLYVYFFHDAKGFSVGAASVMLIFHSSARIPGALFWGGPMARRFNKHRSLQIACLAYAVAQSILIAVPRMHGRYGPLEVAPTALMLALVGFSDSAFPVLGRAMVADVADEVRLERGRNLTSLLYSMVTTTTKIGASLSITVVFPILALAGYKGAEGATNSPHAVLALEMCYVFAPVILVLVGSAVFFGYNLNARRHAEIRAALAQLDHAAPDDPVEQSSTAPVG